MVSVAEYNNNPGNLRPPKGVTYEGQIGVDERGFAIFETPAAGRQALMGDIRAKMGRGLNTPEAFIDRYAPAGDENPEDARENYKVHLATSLGLKSTADPFPEGAIEKLADAIHQFESGQRKPPEPAREAVEPTVEPGGTLEAKERSEVPGATEMGRLGAGVTGGLAGLGVAGSLETARKVSPLLPNVMRTVARQAMDPSEPMSRMALQKGLQSYLSSQISPNIKLSLTELEKLVGTKIRTMSEVQQALKAIQTVKPERAPVTRSIDPESKMARKIYRTTPGRPGVDLSAYEVKPRGPVRAAIGREAQAAGELMRGIAPSIGRVALGGLGGVSAATQGYDAYEQYRKEGMSPRTAAKAAAALGGGMMMLPFGITQGAGLALQAPEMAISTYELLREAQRRHQKEIEEGGLPPMAPTMGDVNPYGQ